MQDEITRLMEGVTEKGNHVEALDKDLNMLKLKHDMLMAEKDELTTKSESNGAGERGWIGRESSSQTGLKSRERPSGNFASHWSIKGADIKNFAKHSLGSSVHTVIMAA
ncbi:hypothetical protein Dsin_031291 [Dipteronia sinensis]|uniref:Uncharacterized protein n=1 Tax=Dipteronia sinensis TaxID=43782 RepID=A0AAD9ZM65_9ROSI|nr:hypothetical protein Dsin_031291 [Dipteronia sinensis]